MLPKRKLTKDNLNDWLIALRTSKSLNFPKTARTLSFDYASQIKPRIEGKDKQDEWFREELASIIEEIKFDLIEKMLDVASKGKIPNQPNPEISYIKGVIAFIDGGGLLGKGLEEEGEEEPDKDELGAHAENLSKI